MTQRSTSNRTPIKVHGRWIRGGGKRRPWGGFRKYTGPIFGTAKWSDRYELFRLMGSEFCDPPWHGRWGTRLAYLEIRY